MLGEPARIAAAQVGDRCLRARAVIPPSEAKLARALGVERARRIAAPALTSAKPRPTTSSNQPAAPPMPHAVLHEQRARARARPAARQPGPSGGSAASTGALRARASRDHARGRARAASSGSATQMMRPSATESSIIVATCGARSLA